MEEPNNKLKYQIFMLLSFFSLSNHERKAFNGLFCDEFLSDLEVINSIQDSN